MPRKFLRFGPQFGSPASGRGETVGLDDHREQGHLQPRMSFSLTPAVSATPLALAAALGAASAIITPASELIIGSGAAAS